MGNKAKAGKSIGYEAGKRETGKGKQKMPA